MKLVFGITMFVLISLGLSFGVVQAQNPSIPSADITETATPTLTSTVTPTETTVPATATATTNPCDGHLPPPTLVSPDPKAIVKTSQVKLKWDAVDCTRVYKIIVRRDAKKTGALVYQGKSHGTSVTTGPLQFGHTYFWYVKDCNQLCGKSNVQQFSLPALPTPIPPPATSTPPPGATPTPGGGGNPGGCKTAPPNVKNCSQNGVYLNTDHSALFFFPCSSLHYDHFGSTIYFAVIGFQPNERVSVGYQVLGRIPDLTPYTTLTADGNGNVQMSWDGTGAQNADHWHWWFTSTSATYCGHFDWIK